MIRKAGLISSVLLLAAGSPLLAQDAPSGPQRDFQESLAASVNNLGVQSALDYSRTWPLSGSQSPLRKDAHFSIGVSQAVTPSNVRLGGWVELSPLSILDLRAGIEPSFYFGTFDSLVPFSSQRDPFDGASRDVKGSEARAGFAGRVYLSPTVKMKVGPFITASHTDFEWWRTDAVGPFFYEPTRDTLLRSSGDHLFVMTNVLLKESALERGTLSLGLVHGLTYVDDAPENRSQYVGLLAIRQYSGRRFGLDRLRILARVSYYLNDPYKQGQLAAALAASFNLGG